MSNLHYSRTPLLRRGALWWVATLLFLLLAVLTLTGKNGGIQTLRLRSIRAELAKEAQMLAEENQAMRTELTMLRRQDPEAVERRAREDLGMVRPGEIRIDFKDPAAPSKR